MTPACRPLPRANVRLLDSPFLHRANLNRAYIASLTVENLVQNYALEAGLRQWTDGNSPPGPEGTAASHHWGWESPTCQVRGHFLGHWLSAAAQLWAANQDAELKLKADQIVAELARCQDKHGGGWCSPIPEKYMHWLANGQPTWAPHYVHHKTLMGLHDMWMFARSDLALQVADRLGDWFHAWSGDFSQEKLDDILDVETGAMLEAWADLYGATGEAKYLDLIQRYTRRRLFDVLLAGKDPLTNLHANTTIPEAHGAARCYEVTGDERWRAIVEAYWKCAVTDRGAFCTGGQTSGEIWTPPVEFAARRGDKNQEHCTVYNMIRLADYIFRWTGEARYLDYIERNLYNGILAQQHPHTGMISYFLPLEAGAHKRWGSPTNDFWCCHGSLVQAHVAHAARALFADEDGFLVAQYIPAEMTADWQGTPVRIRLELDPRNGSTHALVDRGAAFGGSDHRPNSWLVRVRVTCEPPVPFVLKLRLPEWLSDNARLQLNGRDLDCPLNLLGAGGGVHKRPPGGAGRDRQAEFLE